MQPYEIRDPIHKRITFDESERKIIDHPFFQRMRFISQLSFLQTYVYPGAVHTRFMHGLGAMHVAGRLFGKVIEGTPAIVERLTAEEIDSLRQRLRLAGLLHDIGHGPFSHECESIFPMRRALPMDWSWWQDTEDRPTVAPSNGAMAGKQAHHEDYSVLLLQAMVKEGALDKILAQDIGSLIHVGVTPSNWMSKIEQRVPSLHALLRQLISGEADADRMDYLLRDSYFCGVAYGAYDIDWLISSMSAHEHNGRFVLALAENGVRAFEAFLLARYHMFDQVYFHKTKAGFIHYLEQAIATDEIPLMIPTDPYAYAALHDGAVIEQLFTAALETKNYWSQHIMSRIPARRILRLQEGVAEDMQTLEKIKKICELNDILWFIHRAGKELTSLGSDASHDLFVEKKILGGSKIVPMMEYSDLLMKYNEKLRFVDVFVHREDVDRFEKMLKAM